MDAQDGQDSERSGNFSMWPTKEQYVSVKTVAI